MRARPWIAVCLGLLSSTPAYADFDKYCGLPGHAAPLRQTVVLLDEHHISPEPNGAADEKNRPWRQFLGALLLPSNASALDQNFEPRERVTIAIARKDGGGLKQVFAGCLPTYSVSERTRITQSRGLGSSVQAFFGRDALSDARRDMDLFRIQLGNAFKTALAPEALSRNAGRSTSLGNNSFVTSLRQAKLYNPYNGVARVIVYSDLSRFLRAAPQDAGAARRLGMQLGQQTDVNLGGAELYLAGMGSNQSPAIRDALNSFFLAMHADLIAASPASALPAFSAAPRKILRYQGVVRYPEVNLPIKIRLTADQNGTLVNSWLWVQADKEQFAPLRGVVTCEPNGLCTYTGDQQFAQVWNANRKLGAEPLLDPSLPFGGARIVDLRIDGETLNGAISDPLVRFTGLKSFKLEFRAKRQSAALF